MLTIYNEVLLLYFAVHSVQETHLFIVVLYSRPIQTGNSTILYVSLETVYAGSYIENLTLTNEWRILEFILVQAGLDVLLYDVAGRL